LRHLPALAQSLAVENFAEQIVKVTKQGYNQRVQVHENLLKESVKHFRLEGFSTWTFKFSMNLKLAHGVSDVTP